MVIMGPHLLCLDTNCASLHQCSSLCFEGDSPSTETLQTLLGSAGACPEHLEEGPAQKTFLRNSTHISLVPKAPLLSASRVPAVPSEPHSGPPAPKTLCWGRLPVFMNALLQVLASKQKQNLHVQIYLPVSKHSPVLALQWVKPAPHKSRQKLIPIFNGKNTVLFNTLFLLIHHYNCSSSKDTNILFL